MLVQVGHSQCGIQVVQYLPPHPLNRASLAQMVDLVFLAVGLQLRPSQAQYLLHLLQNFRKVFFYLNGGSKTGMSNQIKFLYYSLIIVLR